MGMKDFTAGYAKMDITPHLGGRVVCLVTDLAADCLMDPLYVRAIALGHGDKAAVMFIIDNPGVGSKETLKWPQQLAKDLGLEENAVNFSSTHTHTSASEGADPEYRKFLYRRLLDAGFLALKDRKPVTDVQWAEDRAEGMTFSRRYRMVDGTVETNPVRAEGKHVAPAAHFDDTMRVVRIMRENAKEIVLVNFQSHPDNVGNRSAYSADFPGLFCDYFEKSHEDVHCMYLNGAEGELITRGPKPYAKDHRYEWLMNYSKRLAEIASEIYPKTVSTNMTGLSYGQKTIYVKTKWDPDNMEEYERIYKLHCERRYAEIHPSERVAACIAANAGQQHWLNEYKEAERSIFLSAIHFCGLALAGISGEPFSQVGIDVREGSPYPVTCVCCLTNGVRGYFPTAEAFEQGGYETFNTPVMKGSAEAITEASIELLNSI